MPKNAWTSANEPLSWGIYRNIPFVILGAILVVLYYKSAKDDALFHFLWLAVVISFACYIPVTLEAKKHPMIGMLMMPKTLAYVAMIVMGLKMLA